MQDITYMAHVSELGWLDPVPGGSIAGTVGQGRPMEAFRIVEHHVPKLGITGNAHVQDIGWAETGIMQGQDVGTTGLGKHIEAVRLDLFGEAANDYTIWYRLHVANFGFLPWSRNGEENGTIGGNNQAEAIQIMLARNDENFWPANDYPDPLIDLTPKVDKRELVLQKASSWVGYQAGAVNAFGVTNYCIAFVSTCMRESGIDFINTAWCDDAKYWAINKGIWIPDPYAGQRGLAIAFDFDNNGVTNHFGLVESVRDDGGYNTIEANTGNPTGIYRKVRYVDRDGIEGFINPY